MSSILDRSVIGAGKVFIKAGQDNSRAYIIQSGVVRAFLTGPDEEKIVVGEYQGGRIIGETCLMVDEPMRMSYEAVTDLVLVAVTRQDFLQRIAKIDKDVKKVLEYMMTKLNYQEVLAMETAEGNAKIDPDAQAMVDSMIGNMSPDKKFQYEKAMLPHLNAMIKAMKDLKKSSSKPAGGADLAKEEQALQQEAAS